MFLVYIAFSWREQNQTFYETINKYRKTTQVVNFIFKGYESRG